MEYRNVIILLDQEGDMENIGRLSRFFLTNKLQSALDEEICPIIINTSLWNNFIERRLSIQQMSEITNSPEQKALDTYNKIGNRLTYWVNFYKDKNVDPMAAKQLSIDKVNEEFYLKDITDDNKEITKETSMALMSYLTRFNKNSWEVYSSNSFYLLIPKKYIAKLDKNVKVSNDFSEKELLLGFKVDHLNRVDNSEDSAVNYFNDSNNGQHISNFLGDFFITKRDIDLSYKWNIIFSGHGGYRYREITTDKVVASVEVIIADLPPLEFCSILEFCEHLICTNCFHYSTCYGAGNHIKMIYDDKKYNYTIICGCISDVYATCLYNYLPFPTANKTKLKLADIMYADQKWNIKVDHKYKWDEFFNSLGKNSFISDDLTWLIDILPTITYPELCDNPLIRLPKSDIFVPILSDKIVNINKTLIGLKANEITITQSIILVNVDIISIPLIVQNEASMSSIFPGNAYHYLKRVEARKCKFLNLFTMINGDYFDKYFVVEELIVKNDKDSIIEKMLKIGDVINMRTVFVFMQKDFYMRIFAQISENYYMIVINKNSDKENEFKYISKLNKESLDLYLKMYDRFKSKVLS